MESSVLTQIVLPLCLFVIMFGMGLSLVTRDFTRVVLYPQAALLGLFGQLVLLPFVGFLVAYLFVSDPVLAMGLMLVAACPGGTTSNLITSLARGDLALSISLTAFSSLFTIVSIPLIVGFSFIYFGEAESQFEMPVGRTIATLFLITLLPVGLGMAIRAKWFNVAAIWEPRIQKFSAVFLVVLVILLVYQQRDTILGFIIDVGPASFLLNALTMSLGYIMATALKLRFAQITSITIEVGVQNSTLAILIATTLLGSSELAIPAAVYSLVMYFTGGAFVILRRYQKAQAVRRAS